MVTTPLTLLAICKWEVRLTANLPHGKVMFVKRKLAMHRIIAFRVMAHDRGIEQDYLNVKIADSLWHIRLNVLATRSELKSCMFCHKYNNF